MPHRSAISSLQELSAVLFRDVRRLVGPFHRRRRTLSDEEWARQQRLTPLPAPWNEDERWYRGGFPPRSHNHLLPLVHGVEYFADLYETLRAARTRVTICGWCLTPLLPLVRGDGEAESLLGTVLNDVSARADVYVLLWAGAPLLFPLSLIHI